MYDDKAAEKVRLDLQSVRQAYYAIKEVCYECNGGCDHCRVGEVRKELVELEKYMGAILGE